MKILGLIPARGGSKGVPGKNIKLIGGKPLLEYTFEQAKKSHLLDRVVISTDDIEIAKVANDMGLEVPFIRPKEFANDNSGSLGVVHHALEFFESQGIFYDAVCLLQVTSPLRPEGSIDEALSMFIRNQPDSLVSVRKVPDEFNPHWTFKILKDNKLKISTNEKLIIPRRQDLPVAYHRDGAVYISSKDTIKYKGSLLGNEILGFPLDTDRLINIDTMEDWHEAEAYIADHKGFE